jgi:DNA-binding transcriptional regulator YdaS (Cro superfamily)
VQAKVNALQEQMAQANSDQQNVAREIEEKKNSDLYTFAQIIKERAQGELETAREALTAFPQKFPASPLVEQARTQLAAVTDQISAEEVQRQQQEADAARAAAAARAALLARAAKGQATLTEMRQALVGKSRAQVSDLLGPPSDTASDQWNYRKQMIVNPLTGEQAGLIIYFNEGMVQSLDYLHGRAEGSY